MAIAQNITGNRLQLNKLTHPARPHDYVTLWGTGLATATEDSEIQLAIWQHSRYPATLGRAGIPSA